jgi:hypothetical protein
VSSFSIRIFPEALGHVPEQHKRNAAEVYMSEIALNAREVKSVVTESIQFIACRGNLKIDRTTCPHCNERIDFSWSSSAMDRAWDGEGGFQPKEETLPCCGKTATLHDLNYVRPLGFAKYCLEAINPDRGLLEEEHTAHFKALLGCDIRVIYWNL